MDSEQNVWWIASALRLVCRKKATLMVYVWAIAFGVNIAISAASPIVVEEVGVDSALSWVERTMYEDSMRMEAWEVAYDALALSYATGDSAQMALTHDLLSAWYAYHVYFSPDSGLKHELAALELYQALNNQEKTAEMMGYLATSYASRKKFEEARSYIFDALALYEEMDDQEGIGRVYHNIAGLYEVMENWEEAIDYRVQAQAIFEAHDMGYNLALNYMELITSLRKVEDYQAALAAYDRCMEVIESGDFESAGILIRATNARGQVYKDMGEYKKAETDFRYAYESVRDLFSEEAALSWQEDVGVILMMQDKYQEALPWLVNAESYYGDKKENSVGIQELYEELATCYREVGNFEQALHYTELVMSEQKAALEGQIENLESEVMAKYESGKKDEALAQQQRQIDQQRQIQGLSLGGVGLLLTLLVVLGVGYRRRQRTAQTLQSLNENLSVRNQENELLLKEVHHRVKNNLQVISSLLSLQSRHIQDKQVRHAILDSESRVRSMSLIHQRLYRGNNLAAVEMKNYFSSLTDTLVDAYADESDDIEVLVDMPQIELDVEYAVPLGLITNELITNTLKYAFGERGQGTIFIRMQQEQNELILEVADDGSGAKSAPDPSGGFGGELVEMLTQQLKGKISQQRADGYRTRIRFPYSAATA